MLPFADAPYAAIVLFLFFDSSINAVRSLFIFSTLFEKFLYPSMLYRFAFLSFSVILFTDSSSVCFELLWHTKIRIEPPCIGVSSALNIFMSCLSNNFLRGLTSRYERCS